MRNLKLRFGFLILLSSGLIACNNPSGTHNSVEEIKTQNDNQKEFELVDNIYYHQSLSETPLHYRKVHFNDVEYDIRFFAQRGYRLDDKDNEVKQVSFSLGKLKGENDFEFQYVDFSDFFEEFSVKYNFQDSNSEFVQLHGQLIDEKIKFYQVNLRYKKGFKGSSDMSESLENINFLKKSKFFLSQDGRVLVECWVDDEKEPNRLKISSGQYQSASEWVDETRREIQQLQYLETIVFQESQGF
jgi:hypothetical protein